MVWSEINVVYNISTLKDMLSPFLLNFDVHFILKVARGFFSVIYLSSVNPLTYLFTSSRSSIGSPSSDQV